MPLLLQEALGSEAQVATDIASAVYQLGPSVPESSVAVRGVLGQLFGISAQLEDLKRLEAGLYSERDTLQNRGAVQDLSLAVLCLSRTFKDIKRVLGRRYGDGQAVQLPEWQVRRKVWMDLNRLFVTPVSVSLLTRLDVLRSFFVELGFLFSGNPGGFSDMELLRQRIQDMREEQRAKSIAEDLDRLSLGSSESADMFDTPFQPLSSPTSIASPTFFPTYVPAILPPPPHWASGVFDGQHSITLFKADEQSESKVYGAPKLGAEVGLSRDCELLLTLKEFDHSFPRLQIYRCEDTKHVYIHCMNDFNYPGVGPIETFEQLGKLKFTRELSCLKIISCEKTRAQEVWAKLSFSTYERLVLFFCILNALKFQLPSSLITAPRGCRDLQLDDEKVVFAAEISDDEYLHHLRILHDKVSGGVRLEASAVDGPMKGVPIWTAFITQYVGASAWLNVVGTRIVHLKDLRPYVFTSDYSAENGLRAGFELRFIKRQDTRAFVEALDSIRVKRTKRDPFPRRRSRGRKDSGKRPLDPGRLPVDPNRRPGDPGVRPAGPGRGAPDIRRVPSEDGPPSRGRPPDLR